MDTRERAAKSAQRVDLGLGRNKEGDFQVEKTAYTKARQRMNHVLCGNGKAVLSAEAWRYPYSSDEEGRPLLGSKGQQP